MAAAAPQNNGEDLPLVIDTVIPDYKDPDGTATQSDVIVNFLKRNCPPDMAQEEWNHFVKITNEAREVLVPNETRRQALSPATRNQVLQLTMQRLQKEGFTPSGQLQAGYRRPNRNNWAQDFRPAFNKPPTPAGYSNKEYENAWKGVKEKYYCWSKHQHASSKRLEQGLASGDVYDDVVKTLKKRYPNRNAAPAAPGEDDN